MHIPRSARTITALCAVIVTALALHAGGSVTADAPHRTLAGTSPAWASTSQHPAQAGTVSAQALLTPTATEADVAAVRAWLIGAGLSVGEYRSSITTLPFSGTRTDVASAFNTTFVSTEAAGTRAVAPATDLAVPTQLRALETVSGLVDADAIRPTVAGTTRTDNAADTPTISDDCAEYWGEKLSADWPASVTVTHRSNALCGYGPEQLRAIHELPDSATGDGARIAIVAAYDDPSVEENTNSYFSSVGAKPFAPGQYTHHAPGNPDASRCGGPSAWTVEQHLDVQAVHAIAPDADVVYWGADDCLTGSLYLRILDAAQDPTTPDVISLSFGAPEELDTDADRVLLNRVLVEAASLNVSVFASTGNDGDYSDYGDHADESDVASPASSPYVTAVGGTSVGLGESDNLVVEAGWAIQTRFAENGAIIPPGFLYGAGGGESAYYARPSWQQGLGAAGTGRLLPDVASLADPNTGFVIHAPIAGELQYDTHGGTSLATPMVAATVAIAKVTSGAEVGLATPSLYALAGTDAIRDVQPASAATWYRRSASTGQLWLETVYMWDTKPQSLQSGPGWDPLTGLGVPTGTEFITTFGTDR
ncbi:MAG: S53 family peptidase [Mycetocola sp.]